MSDPSVQSISGVSPTTASFVGVVRAFMRDHAALNRLVDGQESSDRMILFAIMDAVSRYNGTTPPTQYSLQDIFQLQRQYLLLRMVVITLLESVMLLQARNHVNYSTGGTSVGANDKAPLLMNMLQYFRTTVDQELKMAKVSDNILSILGGGPGVHSEYWSVHNSYVFW